MRVWITIVHNFPMNSARQSIHIWETQEEAQKSADSWNSKQVRAWIAEVSLIQLLNSLTSNSEFYHLEWLYPPQIENALG